MKKYITLLGMSLLPVVAFAQVSGAVNNVDDILAFVSALLNAVFPVLVALAVIVLIWGIFKFILNAGDEEARKTGRSMILWGIIGIFLMLSIWGLVNILSSSVSLNNTIPTAPNPVPTTSP